jgi:hypothetical protein
MRSLIAIAVLASIPALAACEASVVVTDPAPIDPVDATLTVANDSSFVITEIHLTGVQSSTWGSNLLLDAMFPGESVVLVDIPCRHYDVMVTDETGLDCVLGDLSLCFSDKTWVISDNMLDTCAFGKR